MKEIELSWYRNNECITTRKRSLVLQGVTVGFRLKSNFTLDGRGVLLFKLLVRTMTVPALFGLSFRTWRTLLLRPIANIGLSSTRLHTNFLIVAHCFRGQPV
jgi:hypothetical protein